MGSCARARLSAKTRKRTLYTRRRRAICGSGWRTMTMRRRRKRRAGRIQPGSHRVIGIARRGRRYFVIDSRTDARIETRIGGLPADARISQHPRIRELLLNRMSFIVVPFDRVVNLRNSLNKNGISALNFSELSFHLKRYLHLRERKIRLVTASVSKRPFLFYPVSLKQEGRPENAIVSLSSY